MKNLLFILMVVFTFNTASAQSDSYQTFKDTFKGGHDVHSFSVSGWLARTALSIADEHEFKEVMTDIKNIKFTVVPAARFMEKNISVSGFKKILKEDTFEELARVRDHDDWVTFFVQEDPKKRNNNLYFILVEETDEVVAIEMRGYVDATALMKMQRDVASN